MSKINTILAGILLTVSLTGCADMVPGTSKLGSTINISSYSNSEYTDFILKHSYKLGQEKAENIASLVSYYGKSYNVDPKLVLSLMAVESSFRADAVSSAGAVGLGQLMEGTAKDMGVTDRFDPEENIKGTVKYISWLSKLNNGDLDKILASYNYGPGAVANTVKKGTSLPASVQKYVSTIKNYYSA